MKKVTIIAVYILSVLFFSTGLHAQDANAVVKKCIDALGGEQAVKKHMDYKASGKLVFSMRGMTMPGEMETVVKHRKSWQKVKMKFGGNEFIIHRAFNGKVAWMDMRGNIMTQQPQDSESELDHAITILVEKDAKFSMAKDTEIEGKKALGIEVDFKGKKTTVYVQKDTYLPIEVVFKDYYYGFKNIKELQERRNRYMDYKEIDGVMFPTTVKIFNKGQPGGEFVFEKVEFSPTVDPEIFERPDQEFDLRYREEMMH